MTECSTVTLVTIRTELSAPWFTASQEVALLTEDFVIATRGGGSSSFGDHGYEGLDMLLTRATFIHSVTNRWMAEAMKKKQKKTPSEAEVKAAVGKYADQWLASTIAGASWPPKSLAAELKKGEVAKVDDCAFPGRTVLGTCSFGEAVPGAAWQAEERHYSVAVTVDSDAAFKRCAKLGGKWSAPDPESPEVASERLKQHARKLQEIADPDRLRRQMKRLQNQLDDN